jgi:hypothetical protein
MSIESIINQSLDRIGYKRHIGSIWDGSPAARIALNAWAETRDALLVRTQPEWARDDVALTVLKTAPPYYDEQTPWNADKHPDLPWLYEYAQPETCLVPLALKPRPHTLPIWRPRAMRFRIKTDSSTYVLLGNDPDPILTCIVHTHDPDVWYEDFKEVMIVTLAKKIEVALGHPTAAKQEAESGNNAR